MSRATPRGIRQVEPARERFRIVMVAASPFPYPQGSQVLISQLSSALQQRGHQVRLVTYHFGIGQPPAGVAMHRIRPVAGGGPVQARPSWQKLPLDWMLAGELWRTVRRCRPDVMHTHNFEGLLAALFVRWLTGVPVVHHVHNAMGLELPTYFRGRPGRAIGGLVGRWVDAHLVPRADACIVLSEAAAGYFRQRGVGRIDVIPPGIALEVGDGAAQQQPPQQQRAQKRARRAQRLMGDGPSILYSGNLDRYQDLDLLLHAFGRVAAARPEARLVFSTNAAPDEYEARAAAMGIGERLVVVRSEGFDTARDLLAAADVAVCPRLVCLGFPIKLLNYMAAGKAIVASAGSACGLRHLENGWVVANGDAAGMAEAILALLDDPALAQRLGEGARATAEQVYPWERAVAATEGVYARLKGARGAPGKRRKC